MKLYVCYGTWKPAPRPGGHPCGRAYHSLKDAGHSPEVIKSYGLGVLPDALNQTPGRKEAQRLPSPRSEQGHGEVMAEHVEGWRAPSVTIEDLERWENNGAMWRPFEVTDT